jgi:hypothetical protein
MKNPFEQLDTLQSGAAHCFEEVASIILRRTLKDVHRVRVYCGDGGVDSFTGTWGETGEIDVYQIKYFITQWSDSHQQDIRDAYKTAANSSEYNLRDWILVVPSDLTRKDWQWFDNWRAKTAKKTQRRIEVIEGAKLVDLLAKPECAAARQKLRDWQVQGLPSGASWEGWVAIVPDMEIYPKFSAALLVNVWLQNVGDKSARSVRLRLEHFRNDMLSPAPDQRWWRKSATSLNPWELECTKLIHRNDPVPIIAIPYHEMPAEVSLSLRITAEDLSPVEMVCRFRPNELNLQQGARVYFSAA